MLTIITNKSNQYNIKDKKSKCFFNGQEVSFSVLPTGLISFTPPIEEKNVVLVLSEKEIQEIWPKVIFFLMNGLTYEAHLSFLSQAESEENLTKRLNDFALTVQNAVEGIKQKVKEETDSALASLRGESANLLINQKDLTAAIERASRMQVMLKSLGTESSALFQKLEGLNFLAEGKAAELEKKLPILKDSLEEAIALSSEIEERILTLQKIKNELTTLRIIYG